MLGLAMFTQLDDDIPGTHIFAPNYAQVYAMTAIAPTYCSLMGQGLANTVWWSFALIAVSLHHFFHSLIYWGRESISRLEALKYEARGA
jgi:hypothetical protein